MIVRGAYTAGNTLAAIVSTLAISEVIVAAVFIRLPLLEYDDLYEIEEAVGSEIIKPVEEYLAPAAWPSTPWGAK